jgi:hypothetical protein
VQLGQGDVDGGRERRQVGDEAQLAVVAGQAQRHGEPEVIGAGADRGYIALQLGDEIVELGGDATHLLSNVVSLTWTMESRTDGEPAGSGLDVLAIGSDGRIRTDYQFIGA